MTPRPRPLPLLGFFVLLLAAAPVHAQDATTPTQSAQPIAPGDRLAVAFHIAVADPNTSYTVEPGDELYLAFRWSPELSQVYVKKLLDDEEIRRQDKTLDKISVLSRAAVVQPDGTLALTGLRAPLKVAGLTTLQIAERVSALYKKEGLLEHPDLNVTVDPQYQRHEALRRTLAAGGGRQILVLPVPADGRINLPLVTDVAAAGRGVTALGEELTRRYRALGYGLVTVTVWFDQGGGGTRLRVLGEVRSPGIYWIGAGADVWEAIALAGGFTAEADVNGVRVVGRQGGGGRGPLRLDDYLAGGAAKAAVELNGDELIFVPRK